MSKIINLLKLKLYLRDFFSIYNHRLSMATWGNPIIVYQMPKTGSASIAASLKKIGFHNVFHIHKLDPNDNYPFKYSQKLSALLNHKVNNTNTKFKVITCVRDPIARNVSDLFQILKMGQKFHCNGLVYPLTFPSSEKFLKQNMELDEIRELFLKNYPYHDLPLSWLDEHINKNLGIDLFSYNFPKDKGYLRIYKDNIELLVLKLESSDAIKEEQISEFVGNNRFKLIKTNVTSDDTYDYSRLYNEFKKNLHIPLDYLEKMYSSKFVNHFYSEQEVEFMRSYWLREKMI
ncbi:MAG: putative capsular polysaccharide synthesis family protein [Rivularia sp. (in: cyanobacteria)]